MAVRLYYHAAAVSWMKADKSVVLGGSSGESVTLTRSEKDQLIRRTREIARRHGKDRYAITVGCLGGCTRDVVEQTRAGHESGADFALVVIPGVFHWAMSQQAIVDFYREVADHSPLPIVIYNIPSIVSGLDVNSDMLATLSAHANISGVKLTCGGVGKITRIAAQTSPSRFAAVCGQSDWLVPALMAGGAGCISGVANLFPTVAGPIQTPRRQ
jgi:4-hydroxy-2-oxoglutarate aldolase